MRRWTKRVFCFHGNPSNACAYLVQIGELHHVGKIHAVSIRVDILKGQDFGMIVFEVDSALDTGLGAAASITHHGLFISVLRDVHDGLPSLGSFLDRRSPCEVRIADEDIRYFLSHGCLIASVSSVGENESPFECKDQSYDSSSGESKDFQDFLVR